VAERTVSKDLPHRIACLKFSSDNFSNIAAHNRTLQDFGGKRKFPFSCVGMFACLSWGSLLEELKRDEPEVYS